MDCCDTFRLYAAFKCGGRTLGSSDCCLAGSRSIVATDALDACANLDSGGRCLWNDWDDDIDVGDDSDAFADCNGDGGYTGLEGTMRWCIL